MSKLILFRDPQTSVTGSRQALSGPWIAIMWFPMAHLCMTSLLPRGILHHWGQGIEKRRCVPCREQIWSNWTVTYNEEMAIFKILLGTINLILVTKYKYTAFLTFLRANPKAFPQSLFFISLQILMLVSIPNFQSSWDDRPRQFSCIWAHDLHLNDVFHLSSTIQPWVNPEVPSSVLCTHFSPQRAFAHLSLQLSPFLRGITNAYGLPSKQLRFPMIYKMFSGTGSPNPMPHSVFLWHHLSKHRWFPVPQPWCTSHPKLSSLFYSSHYGNHSYLVFPPRDCPFLVLLTITTPICLCANY